jgi:pyridoxine 5'-phosphate synthase PdxJ
MLEDGVDIKDKSELDGLVKKLKKVGIEVSISSAVQKKSNN